VVKGFDDEAFFPRFPKNFHDLPGIHKIRGAGVAGMGGRVAFMQSVLDVGDRAHGVRIVFPGNAENQPATLERIFFDGVPADFFQQFPGN
jgi:hypothetical protein